MKVIFKMKYYLESIASFTEVGSFTRFVVSVIMWHIVAEYGLEGCVGGVTQHEFFWKFKFGLIVRNSNLFLFFLFLFSFLLIWYASQFIFANLVMFPNWWSSAKKILTKFGYRPIVQGIYFIKSSYISANYWNLL